MKKTTYILIPFLIIFALIIIFVFNQTQSSIVNEEQSAVTNFEQCLVAGNPIMESYPRQCRDSQGNIFIENIGNGPEKQDLIQVINPTPNQEVSSPLIVSGQARGYWFFEGDFPVVLADWDGKIIVQSTAQAKGNWMSEDFVPFEAELIFSVATSVSNHGSLILQKDNPSGLPANDDVLEIPIKFR